MSLAAGAHALCSGRVWHVRRAPFRHGFDYAVHMLLLDLDELEGAFADHPLWSLDAPNLGSFRGADHLGGRFRGGTLAERARGFVHERLGFAPRGAVRLLVHPRYFGFAFNPVTFYFFLDPDGADEGLEAILLEVANTPWNERHVYALDCRGAAAPWHFEIAKDFHVSPFLPMDMTYRFRFMLEDGRIEVVKQNFREGDCVFAARMALAREPLARPALSRALLGFPMTLKVVAAIYWQALRLWSKGAVYHPHPVLEAPSGDGRGGR